MPKTLFSIIESATHPDFSALYASLGIRETRINSMRKAIAELKNVREDEVIESVAENTRHLYGNIIKE